MHEGTVQAGYSTQYYQKVNHKVLENKDQLLSPSMTFKVYSYL